MPSKKFTKFKRSFFRFLREPFIVLCLISTVILIILMVIIFFAEQETNSEINTFF